MLTYIQSPSSQHTLLGIQDSVSKTSVLRYAVPAVIEQALQQEFPVLTEKKPKTQNVKLIPAICF